MKAPAAANDSRDSLGAAPAPAWLDAIARRGWIPAALLAFLLFSPALFYQFTYDDIAIIVTNGRIRELGRPSAYLATNWWDSPEGSFLYRPLPMASFALDYALHGLAPLGYHLVNNLLHALNAALVWLLAWQLARRKKGIDDLPAARAATIAAGLFAVMAVHVEAVAGIVGRAELMMTFGYLAALVGARAIQENSGGAGNRRWIAIVFLATAFSTFSKEHGATLPAAIALLALHPSVAVSSKKSDRAESESFMALLKKRLIQLKPALIASSLAVLAYLIARRAVLGVFVKPGGQQIPNADNPLITVAGLERFLATLDVVARQAGLFLLPWRPSPNYGTAVLIPKALAAGWLWPLGFLVLAGCCAGLWFLRRRRLAHLGLGWLFVTMALASNLIVLIGTILADRLLYLPSAALCLIAGEAAFISASRRRRQAIGATLALWAVVQGGLALRYLPNWHDNRALMEYAMKLHPENANVQLGWATQMRFEGKLDEALKHVDASVRIDPTGFKAKAWRAVMLAEAGRPEARQELEESYAISQSLDIVNRALAKLLTAQGETERAERILRDGIRLAPRSQAAWFSLIEWLGDQGRIDEAKQIYAQLEPHLNAEEKADVEQHFKPNKSDPTASSQ